MTIRLMIVDDSAAIRGVYARMLEDQAHIKIVGSVGDPKEAIKQIPGISPDVVTLDVEMPGLTQRGSKTSIEAERLGAAALLQKPGLGMNPAEFKRIFCAKLVELVPA